MFVYTFQDMWRRRPLEEYLVFVGIRAAHTSFSPFTSTPTTLLRHFISKTFTLLIFSVLIPHVSASNTAIHCTLFHIYTQSFTDQHTSQCSPRLIPHHSFCVPHTWLFQLQRYKTRNFLNFWMRRLYCPTFTLTYNTITVHAQYLDLYKDKCFHFSMNHRKLIFTSSIRGLLRPLVDKTN